MPRLLFLHGLESGPQGAKATWLRTHYDCATPAFDNRLAIEAARTHGRDWGHAHPDIEAHLAGPLAQARAALHADLDLVIGSSFGGALLMRLIHEGAYTGPALFIAGAGPKLLGRTDLPPHQQAILLHGRHDSVVPLEDSRAIAQDAGPGVLLWETGGDHRMRDILASGLLAHAVAWLT